MQYLPLFLLFLAVLIAAWFYLQRAKLRDAGATTGDHADNAVVTATAAPADRSD